MTTQIPYTKQSFYGKIKNSAFISTPKSTSFVTKKRGYSAINNNNKYNSKTKKSQKNYLMSNVIFQMSKNENQIKNINKQSYFNAKESHSQEPKRILNSNNIHFSLLPPKTSNKKTLVLDLDETLVHSAFMPFESPSDVVIQIEIEGQIHDIHVLVRPGVKEFLETMGRKYEIVIFTASLSKYADPLLNILDERGCCQYRLFREHCTLISTSFVKDLQKLGRDIKDIIIVDNSPLSYALNTENGIPILSWFEDKKDRELYHLSPILEFLADVNDVREYIKKFVIDNEIK